MRISTSTIQRWPLFAPTRTIISMLAAATVLMLFPFTAFAQRWHGGSHPDAGGDGNTHGHNVTLHINPRWKECSFQLDPSLTKAAWRQFTREAGLVTYFRPLADASPMGKGKYEVSVLQWETGIDANEPAWNDTFVHPDSVHWLFEGDGLKFPGLAGRVGLTNKTDVGVYVTKSPGANYGFYGVQVQQNLVASADQKWAGSARLSFVSMYGPEDVDFTVYGLDLLASRRYALFSKRVFLSPYAGVSASLSRSYEKSAVVNLADENLLGAQGMVGAAAQIGRARIGAEYGVARVRSISFKVGIGSGTN